MPDKQTSHIKLKYNKYAPIFSTIFRIVLDYLVAVFVVFACVKLRDSLTLGRAKSNVFLPNVYRFVIMPLCYMFFANIYGLYTRRQQFTDEVLCVLKASCLGALAVIVVLYLAKDAELTSRLFIIFWALSLFPCVSVVRLIFKNTVMNNELLATPALLLVGGDVDMRVVEDIHHNISVGYNYVGYLSYNDIQQNRTGNEEIPHLGVWEDAPGILKQHGISHVFIIAHKLPLLGIEQLVATLQPLVKHISIVPTLGKLPLNSADLTTILDGRYVMLNLHNNLNFWYNRLAKFVFDYILTFFGTILLLPVFLIIAIAIRLDSRGPIIFTQERIGHGGKPFKCYKFRSMWQDAEERLAQILADDSELQQEWNIFHKMKNDPRITRVGKFLRATSLDELPQLFNILKGEMSLVGPRPCYASELVNYGNSVGDYFAVRPAITGLWQTSGRSSLDFNDRVRLDTWYAKNWNLWLDIIILWRTVKVVLKGDGAY